MSYFHVWITLRSHQWPGLYKLDLTADELQARVVGPYRAGRSLMISGRRLTPDDIERLEIRSTEEPSSVIKPRVQARGLRALVPIAYETFREGNDVTDDILEPLASEEAPPETTQPLQATVQWLLDKCWAFYEQNRRWPSARELDAQLYRERNTDLKDARRDLPAGLTWPDLRTFNPQWTPDEQELRLTIEGMSRVASARAALEVVVRVVAELARRAAEFQPSSPTDYLSVTSDEVRVTLALQPDDPLLMLSFSLITSGLPGMWRSGGSHETGWSLVLNERGGRRYAGVTGLDDLLRRVEGLRREQQAEMRKMADAMLRVGPTLRGAITDVGGPTQPAEPVREATVEEEPEGQPDPRRVFVVHGRNARAFQAMRAFLLAIGLEPIDFEYDAVAATGRPAPYTGDIVMAGLRLAQAVIVLLTPDEAVALRRELAASPGELAEEFQPRPNVLFEAGMAFISHPNQTVVVELGNVRSFSDIRGIHTVRLDDSPELRRKLIHRLKMAGCQVREHEAGWESAGSFVDAVSFAEELSHLRYGGARRWASEGPLDDARSNLTDRAARAFGSIPLTDAEKQSLVKVVELACMDPVREIQYSVEQGPNGAQLKFGLSFGAFTIAADGRASTLATVQQRHEALMKECRAWPLWARLRGDPGA